MTDEWAQRVKAARAVRVRALAIGVAGLLLLMAAERTTGLASAAAGLTGVAMTIYGLYVSMTHSEVSTQIR